MPIRLISSLKARHQRSMECKKKAPEEPLDLIAACKKATSPQDAFNPYDASNPHDRNAVLPEAFYLAAASALVRRTVISTRRFLERPPSVLLEVTGRVSAYPAISNLVGASLLLPMK